MSHPPSRPPWGFPPMYPGAPMPPNAYPPTYPPYPQPGAFPPYGIPPPMPPVVRPPVPVPPPPVQPQIPAVPYLLDKKTTVFVGNMSVDTENDFILKLLERCGQVDNWKRFKDPNTGIYKTFGFCEYHSAEGALRATRLLSGLEVEGSKLNLKIDEKTRIFLNDYEKRKLELWSKQRKSPEINQSNITASTIGTVEVSEEDKQTLEEKTKKEDEEILQLIDDLLHGKETHKTESEIKKIQSEQMAVQNTVERIAKEAEEEEISEKKQFLAEQIRKFRELEKEREREKIEREREKEKMREREKQRAIERERERERERQRMLQEEHDREKRRKEKELRDLERAERERERQLEKGGASSSSSDSSDEDDRRRRKHGKKRHKKSRKYSSSDSEEERDRKKRRKGRRDRRYGSSSESDEGESKSKSSSTQKISMSLQAAPGSSQHAEKVENVKSVFNHEDEDEEDINKKRQKLTLFMNPEELEKLKKQAFEEHHEAEETGSGDKKSNEEKKELLNPQNIAKAIPAEKQELFAYPVNWALVDKYEIVNRLSSWISNTIAEYLGEPDSTVIEFTIGKLNTHAKPDELLSEMKSILLEEEADAFVPKLWKMLLFETIKVEREIMVFGQPQSSTASK